MAQIFCKYHAQSPARWACHSCRINYCPSCVTTPTGKGGPQCPVCHKELDSLGADNLVNPFWTRFNDFFLYPLHSGPLLLLILLAVANYWIMQFSGWYRTWDILFWRIPRNAVFFVPVIFVFIKYAATILEHIAHGHLKPKPLGWESFGTEMELPSKLIAIIVVLLFVDFTIFDLFGSVGFIFALLVTAVSMPAIIMVLTMERSFFSALNPLTIISVIQRLGMAYVAMLGLITMTYYAPIVLTSFFSKYVANDVLVALFLFFIMYFGFIMFEVMGYLLYQYHELLGYTIEVEAHEQEQGKKENLVTVSPGLRAVEILIQEGKQEEALVRLRQLVKDSPSDTEARNRLLKLLRLTGDMKTYRQVGQEYISNLFHENKIAQAVSVYQQCVEADPGFRPSRPGERLELAKRLKGNAYGKQALALLTNLHQEFPTFDGVPQAYLMVAQLMCETFGKDEEAKQILAFVLENYPHSSFESEIRDYLKIIQDVASHSNG